jgi:hypothetical protein
MGQTNSIYIPPGGSTTLPATYIGYGDDSNLLTGSSDFTYKNVSGTSFGFNVAITGIKGLSVSTQDTNTILAIIGDVNGSGYNTHIQVNDNNQTVLITNVPEYANDTSAINANLLSGSLYKTTTLGSTYLKIVP